MSVKSYKDKNGRTKYYCSFYYTDYNGTKKRKKIEGFTYSKEAKQAEKEFLEKITGSINMTFKALSQLYLDDCKARLKVTTYKGKEYMFYDKIIPFFSDTPITDISPAMIRKWQNNLLTHTPKYAQTYVKTCNNQLSAIFNFAVKYYGLKKNPVRIAGTIGKKYSGRLDFYTIDEYNNFMDALPSDDIFFRMAFELLFYTGIRCGEMLALTTSDCDFTNDTININKNFAVVGGKEYILPPKTPKSKRIVTLPPKISQHLKAYIDSLYEPQKGERLFSTLNKSRLAKMIQKTATTAGIKKIRVHDFRHSHASLLIELGFPPLLISERLGHERVETTLQIYSHLYPSKAELVAKKLNDFIK